MISVNLDQTYCEKLLIVLKYSGLKLHGLEYIISSIEFCFIDNCNLLICGGCEIPILDCSAFGWSSLFGRVGVYFYKTLSYKK